ncbi:MAG: cyclic 2,3-diphosphoglycerate synthase [Burkholderiales bacterium]
MAEKHRIHTVILGAAGRDFHNFNMVYRDDANTQVIAFTATQIPGIAKRLYPPSLSGPLYPEGIPIIAQGELDALLHESQVERVVFAYSDIRHEAVMHLASIALAGGADFLLLGPQRTMIQASVPVIAVSAVRTGCGKSQTVRYLSRRLRKESLRAAIIRHPMPYGDLEAQRMQRFATLADLAAAQCTLEEREEYEPHIAAGNMVYAGVDYAEVVARAQSEADLILWDGGNNDFPFVNPDVHIVLLDSLRPGDESAYHPGEAVLRMADIVVAAKADAAPAADIHRVMQNARLLNPRALLLRGASPVTLDNAAALRGKRVLVVEDGPTITHGGMPYGAAFVAAARSGAAEIVDPRTSAAPEIAAVYAQYPHIGTVLPAMGYSAAQIQALRATIETSRAEVVVSGTPIDLAALLGCVKPVVRVRYEFAEMDAPGLWDEVSRLLADPGARHR